MRSRRGAAVVCLGLVFGAFLVTPAGAHMGTIPHLWSKHLKPLAAKVFYTKKQSNARYYTKASSNTRFALKGDAGRSGLRAYCHLARTSPRSYPAEVCDASVTIQLDVTGSVGEFTSLAIGADGLPVVSYRDATNLANSDLKILHCGNESCTEGNQATVVDGPGDVGAHTSLAIGADGLPIVAYKDLGNGDLKVLHCGNIACTSGNVDTSVDTTPANAGSDTSLAIGADGLPVVSYVDQTNSNLKVLHCGNADCTSGNQATAIPFGPVGPDNDTSLAIGADGLPVVSFYASAAGDLVVLHCGNVACTSGNQTTTVDDQDWVGDFSSLAIGLDGLPVISYRDGTTGELNVLHCGNADCTSASNEITAVDQTAIPLGYDTSIAIGTSGFPVVSYYDSANGDLKVLSCGDEACSSGNQAKAIDTAGTVGRHTAVAIGIDGLPLVSYYDESNADLKLARPPVP